MEKYEYKTEQNTKSNSPEDVVYYLNNMGKNGWELVTFETMKYSRIYYFKRKIEQKTIKK